MVFALAGRRFDPPSPPEPRFPPQNADRVKWELSHLFGERRVTVLVSSAAAGADLLGLEAAGVLRIRRRIVLPFDSPEFRKSSVVDRGDEWGERYDQILNQVQDKEDLIVIGLSPDDDAAYMTTNRVILDEAERLARTRQEPLGAAIVWNGRSRGAGDVTAAFRDEARLRGFLIEEISSL